MAGTVVPSEGWRQKLWHVCEYGFLVACGLLSVHVVENL